MSTTPPRACGNSLLAWYTEHGRKHLPWRKTRNPWRILVSEIMLQQTQVERVITYYRAWFRRFPTVTSLARASEEEVFRVWQGLGYYRRARSLHAAARHLVATDTAISEDAHILMQLPGVGPYTAGALRAFAFDLPGNALDTNVRRVLTRLSGRTDCVDAWLATLMARHSPREVLSALMDLGATVCTARKPQCERCPWSRRCTARRSPCNAKELKSNESGVATGRGLKPELAVGVFRDGRTVLAAARSVVLEAPLAGLSPCAALRQAARSEHGVEIAVRPAYAKGLHRDVPASFHRCTLLYGALHRFKPLAAERLDSASPAERNALEVLGLLPTAAAHSVR